VTLQVILWGGVALVDKNDFREVSLF
jgi:hypothetical protein